LCFLVRKEVRPLLENLAVSFYMASPPPEDIVGFLIANLQRQASLPAPEEGGLDEDERLETKEMEENIKELQAQCAQLQKALSRK